MRRVASRAVTIRAAATIQVTTIELVMGKPNTRAISTARCDSWCVSTGLDLLLHHVHQPHDLGAVPVGDERALLVHADFRGGHELALTGPRRRDREHHDAEIEAGARLGARQAAA